MSTAPLRPIGAASSSAIDDLLHELRRCTVPFAPDFELLSELDERGFHGRLFDEDGDRVSGFEDEDIAKPFIDEAACRLQRGDIAECLVQLERIDPRLDGLAAKVERMIGARR